VRAHADASGRAVQGVGAAAARLLGLWVRITLGACMSFSCECYVLPGRGLCDNLSKGFVPNVACDLEVSTLRTSKPTRVFEPCKKRKYVYTYIARTVGSKKIPVWFYGFVPVCVVCTQHMLCAATTKIFSRIFELMLLVFFLYLPNI
jgi:hypothetical protein